MVIPSKKKGSFLGGKNNRTTGCGGGAMRHISEEKLNQLIRERAYSLWEEQGRPDGQDFNNWVRAEKEVKSKVNY